jgi:hypothetical protein
MTEERADLPSQLIIWSAKGYRARYCTLTRSLWHGEHMFLLFNSAHLLDASSRRRPALRTPRLQPSLPLIRTWTRCLTVVCLCGLTFLESNNLKVQAFAKFYIEKAFCLSRCCGVHQSLLSPGQGPRHAANSTRRPVVGQF